MKDSFQNHRARTGVQSRERRRFSRTPSSLRHSGSVDDAVAAIKPALPLYVLRPEMLERAAAEFTALFPGDTMYAVKCNPHKTVLQALYRGGVKVFDVASIEEARLAAKAAPKAKLCFMHPVKSPEAIREAYSVQGIRTFVLDTAEELYKIMRETDLAPDLELFVRVALPKNGSAAIDFASKFGASPDDAAALLNLCRPVSAKLGLCFHVGTQTMDPVAYGRGIDVAAKIIRKSGVTVDVLDIGGGFPVSYPDQTPPSLPYYMKAITDALYRNKLQNMPLLAEPGRALVAAAGSLVVRVEQRRGDLLYINDGTYGGLFDAGPALNTRYPVRMIRPGSKDVTAGDMMPYRFAGPTCDSLDMMAGPFMLPADIAAGDWIEIGNLGAYSAALRSNFNGFGPAATIQLFEKTDKATTRRKQ